MILTQGSGDGMIPMFLARMRVISETRGYPAKNCIMGYYEIYSDDFKLTHRITKFWNLNQEDYDRFE